MGYIHITVLLEISPIQFYPFSLECPFKTQSVSACKARPVWPLDNAGPFPGQHLFLFFERETFMLI